MLIFADLEIRQCMQDFQDFKVQFDQAKTAEQRKECKRKYIVICKADIVTAKESGDPVETWKEMQDHVNMIQGSLDMEAQVCLQKDLEQCC